jgi:hypothetical protein
MNGGIVYNNTCDGVWLDSGSALFTGVTFSYNGWGGSLGYPDQNAGLSYWETYPDGNLTVLNSTFLWNNRCLFYLFNYYYVFY